MLYYTFIVLMLEILFSALDYIYSEFIGCMAATYFNAAVSVQWQ